MGANSQTFNTPGVLEHAFFVRQIADARAIRSRLNQCLERADQPDVSDAERQRLLTWVVVGGGPTSVEFAAELYDLVHDDLATWYPRLRGRVRIVLLEAADNILTAFDADNDGVIDAVRRPSPP